MEHQIADAEGRLAEAAFDSAAVPLMVFDLDSGRCLQANRAADAAYGYRAQEWRTVALSDLYESRAALESALRGLAAGPAAAETVRHRRRDGSGFWVHASLTPLAAGPRRHAVLNAQDVTRQQDMLAEADLMRDHFALAQELTGQGHCIVDLRTGRQSWSCQHFRNFGLPPGSVPIGGVPGDPAAGVDAAVEALLSRVDAQDRKPAHAALRACLDAGTPFDAEWRVPGPEGEARILRVEGMRKDDCGGRPYAFVCISVDVTEKHRTEEVLRQTRIDLSRAQRIAQVGSWIVDLTTGKATTTSDETRRILGFDDDEVTLARINSLIHPDDLPAVQAARAVCIAHPGTGYFVQYRVTPRPGELRYVESQGEVQTDDAGKPVRMVGYMRDVTEARLAEQEIQRLAYCDELTGLPNRVALRRELERSTSIDTPHFAPLALVVIDVARFQDICLTVGQDNSDALLKDVAGRIRDVLGKDIYLARIGNGLFAAIMSDTDTYDSKPRARSVLKAFEAPFQVAGIQYDINAHIGISLFPGHGTDAHTLFRKANVALFRARQIGIDMVVYDPEDDPYQPERLALLGEFRKAVQDGQIELYCQPKVEMRTDEVIGAEALVRWRHPQRGMISPALFVPLVEDTELIHVLTRHMLQAAVRQCFNWQREGVYVPIAVNVSPRNLLHHDLAGSLETLLHTWGGTPEWLGLEITESSLISDPDASIAELTLLSGMGFRLFIDDFGTGYSSLSYLTRMPVNVIKVDNAFTMHMVEDRRAAAIVKSTIELAHNLGMTVVAEGTSNREIWDALQAFGCDEAQGYYVAEPFPAADFGAWLRSTGRRVGRRPGGGGLQH
jgi:diguanylate cyclase (GGDEF)-like protein/PAS domain S-box-containing protein